MTDDLTRVLAEVPEDRLRSVGRTWVRQSQHAAKRGDRDLCTILHAVGCVVLDEADRQRRVFDELTAEPEGVELADDDTDLEAWVFDADDPTRPDRG